MKQKNGANHYAEYHVYRIKKRSFKLKYSRFLTALLCGALAVCTASCEKEPSSSVEEKTPPPPAEATDPNTVTFDDEDFSFAEIIIDNEQAAAGELSIAEVQGNKMLKFTDDLSVPLKGKVQKISINAAKLVGTENLPKIVKIEFDVYADAVSEAYENEDGDIIKVPGTISCGGGTVTDGDRWYDFAGFEGGEYDFEMSGPVHGEFKFLLADSGVRWTEEMAYANFLIMRWGSENDSNLYVDNIVFYDSDGNSIPLQK